MVETGDATDRLFSGILFKFRKCSLVADKSLRSGLKTQQAHNPGQRPGLCALVPS